MTTGSVLGVVALAGVAAAPSLPVFFAAWLLAGTAMAATFYQPAFTALTRWHQPDHVRALSPPSPWPAASPPPSSPPRGIHEMPFDADDVPVGDTPADLDVGTTAARLLALHQGLLVLVRAGLPRTTLHSVTVGAMASIGSLSTSRKQDDHE